MSLNFLQNYLLKLTTGWYSVNFSVACKGDRPVTLTLIITAGGEQSV